MKRVLVTGASGRLGKAVLPLLISQGYVVRAMSRSPHPASTSDSNSAPASTSDIGTAPGVGSIPGSGSARGPGPGSVEWVVADLATGAGVSEAVENIDVLVHLASAPYKGRYTRQVELGGTSRLLAAARSAGVSHLLYVSIVGVDRVPWGFFTTKLQAERLVQSSGVPYSIVRATQFHEFADQALSGLARIGLLPLDPGIRTQLVDVRDVAARLITRIETGATRGIEELGGPEIVSAEEGVRQWLASRGLRRRIVRVRLPGRLGRAFRAGGLTTDAQPSGEISWHDYLAGR